MGFRAVFQYAPRFLPIVIERTAFSPMVESSIACWTINGECGAIGTLNSKLRHAWLNLGSGHISLSRINQVSTLNSKLRHAWLNLGSEHIYSCRINQVSTLNPNSWAKMQRIRERMNPFPGIIRTAFSAMNWKGTCITALSPILIQSTAFSPILIQSTTFSTILIKSTTFSLIPVYYIERTSSI